MARWNRRKSQWEAASNRHRDLERNSLAPFVPPRCGTRLPLARPHGDDPFGRRESAHPTRHANRFAVGQCALYSRRTLDRSPSARQCAIDSLARTAPRHRQHGDCGGARQRHDDGRRLCSGHRSPRRTKGRGSGVPRHAGADAQKRDAHRRLLERHAPHRHSRTTT